VLVESNGTTRFTPGHGDRRYLRLDPSRRAEILEVLALLASQPPARR
jgi:hypothetical protein